MKYAFIEFNQLNEAALIADLHMEMENKSIKHI
jgi:hypothetical protein